MIDYYYKRLKKLSLIRTLKKNHYDVSYFFKEDCDTLQEENELIERFDKATMEDIFQHIERNYNEIRSAYLTDAKVNAVAADGVRALIDNFKVHPEIGFDMEGSLFSYACRGARLGKFYLRSAQSGTGRPVSQYLMRVKSPIQNTTTQRANVSSQSSLVMESFVNRKRLCLLLQKWIRQKSKPL